VGRVTVLAAALAASAALAAMTAAAAPVPRGQWREAPAYLPLFAAAGARSAAYRAYVSPLDIPAVLKTLEQDAGLLRTPGSWQPRALLPGDAFGQTGRYDRWKLARLYGARRPTVARGPVGADGTVTEAWTLISPYPDPALERLEEGTLLIVLSLGGP
jgi:hypothetical protein